MDKARLANAERLAHDLKEVILPLGIALSAEKSLDRLLERILVEAQRICNADAGTIYLRTDDDHLTFSIVRTDSLGVALGGSTEKAISFPPLPLFDENGKPNRHNVATHVANEGHTVNIPDIYDAEGFDFSGTRKFDKENHYRSTSSLTVPLENQDNKPIGVLQLLNAMDPETKEVVAFDAYAEQVVQSLASQASVALNNKLLMDRQQVLLQIERDVQIGRKIQTGFLPATLPELSDWEVEARFRPAREVSGDFYDVFVLPSDRIAVVMADVCNKGVGAALFMALFRSLLRAFAQQNVNRELVGLTQQTQKESNEQRLSDQLTVLNALYAVPLTNNYVAHTHSDAFMFVTLFFGVLNPKTGKLTYINAGHDAPVVLGPDGVKARLETTGPVVGVLPEAEYDIEQTTLEPGDAVFAYTDGVTEGKDISGALFSEERLLSLLTQPFVSAAELMDRVESNLIEYIGEAVQFDDITMMAVRRKPFAE